ncbi:MAG: polyphosphate polymerase domain-containing protein [Acutalibacteraceae bacterium]
MSKYKAVFKRYEKKYIVTSSQKEKLVEKMLEYMTPDEYGQSTICNIYFDTPDFRIIRSSIEKPLFKEKLRLRSYGVPEHDSNVFVELKKKYKGVVYKRRVHMSYVDALEFLINGVCPEKVNPQVLNEINYFISVYPGIRPTVSLFYDRTAYYGKTDREFRITFDNNIRFRNKNLDLAKGSEGYSLLDADKSIMEIKCIGSMPLWLTAELDRMEIFPSSFSKYGSAYRVMMSGPVKETPEPVKEAVNI